MDNILGLSSCAKGMTVEGLKQTGIEKYRDTGAIAYQNQLYNADWKGEGVLQAMQHFTKDKWRWPTLTGRQQFYIDHPWFVGAGESLPTHKESPKAGGDYPFQMVSCHARWSVHSVWRDTPMMLRLQRGEPVVYLNPVDLAKTGVKDGEYAQLFNDHGDMQMRVKESTMVRPGIAYYFHAWEPFQFKDHRSYKMITPGLMKPMHFAGSDEGHLQWRFAIWEPGTQVQDTRVGIRRIADQQAAASAGGVA
jgi:nitrate reductase alpha subunit